MKPINTKPQPTEPTWSLDLGGGFYRSHTCSACDPATKSICAACYGLVYNSMLRMSGTWADAVDDLSFRWGSWDEATREELRAKRRRSSAQ